MIPQKYQIIKSFVLFSEIGAKNSPFGEFLRTTEGRHYIEVGLFCGGDALDAPPYFFILSIFSFEGVT